MNDRYPLLSIFFHWITAVLIIALFVIGWSMVDLPRGPERSATFALHKSLGLTVLMLSIFRIFWRWRFPAPPYGDDVARWKIRVARIVHALFYVALLFLIMEMCSRMLHMLWSSFILGFIYPHEAGCHSGRSIDDALYQAGIY